MSVIAELAMDSPVAIGGSPPHWLPLAAGDRLGDLARHYDEYPHPPYADHAPHRGVPPRDLLDLARYVLWPRRKVLADARVLDAGCGTGAQLAAMGMRHPDVELWGVDVSARSLDDAADRARRCNVGSVHLRQLPVERVGELGLEFDLVVLQGVLSASSDPRATLSAAASVVRPEGGILVSVAAPYGRLGAEGFRELVDLARGGQPRAERLRFARKLRASRQWHSSLLDTVLDSREEDDASLAELAVLDPPLRAYSVPELTGLLASAGLRIWRFHPRTPYEPERYLPAPHHGCLRAVPEVLRPAVAELLHSAMHTHCFFAVREGFEPERVDLDGEDWLDLQPIANGLWDFAASDGPVPEQAGRAGVATREFCGRCECIALTPWQRIALELCESGTRVRDILRSRRLRQELAGLGRGDYCEAVRSFLRRAAHDELVYLVG